MPFSHSISPDVDDAIDGVASHMIECAIEALEQDDVDSLEEVSDALSEQMIDDTLAIGLDLDERLTLAEHHASDYGFEIGDVRVEDLRSRIEILAVLILHQLGLEQAREHLSTLEDALEDHGLTLSQLQARNPHGWAAHFAERTEGPFQVYEYRNLEGEQIHVDLWDYLDLPGYRVCFEVPIDPSEVTDEENRFDAT